MPITLDGAARFFWLIALVMVFLNAAIMYARTSKRRRQDPELTEGYKKLAIGFIVIGSTPWVIMGWGITSGNLHIVRPFFHPQDGGPFAQAFFASLVIEWIYLAYWVYLGGGAEMMVKHPGFFNIPTSSVRAVKLTCALLLVPGFIFFPIIYVNGFPVP